MTVARHLSSPPVANGERIDVKRAPSWTRRAQQHRVQNADVEASSCSSRKREGNIGCHLLPVLGAKGERVAGIIAVRRDARRPGGQASSRRSGSLPTPRYQAVVVLQFESAADPLESEGEGEGRARSSAKALSLLGERRAGTIRWADRISSTIPNTAPLYPVSRRTAQPTSQREVRSGAPRLREAGGHSLRTKTASSTTC